MTDTCTSSCVYNVHDRLIIEHFLSTSRPTESMYDVIINFHSLPEIE